MQRDTWPGSGPLVYTDRPDLRARLLAAYDIRPWDDI